jgi:hypothetical protein
MPDNAQALNTRQTHPAAGTERGSACVTAPIVVGGHFRLQSRLFEFGEWMVT